MTISITPMRDGWPIRHMAILPDQKGMEEKGDDDSFPSLLFLNGRGDYLEKYAETLEDFAALGWQAESFDWRGQGGSGRFVPNQPLLGHATDFALWLDDLAEFSADWRGRTAAPHVMMGHSMGGHLLLRALAERRVQADAAILIAPMLGLVANGVPHRIGRRIAGAMCALGLSQRQIWPDRRNIAALEEVVRERLTHSEDRFASEQLCRFRRPEVAIDAPSWGWLKAAYDSIDALARPGLLEALDIPILILGTRADKLVLPSAIEQAALRLPQAQVHFYGAEAAHEILREADGVRNDALARIEAFLAQTVQSQ
ncbi:MAG: alpha/beta hydrolase [Sphingobium sp.]|nr:alpha/beta hydrolase [Sphingobium sp.]